jgi:hypothetical protein
MAALGLYDRVRWTVSGTPGTGNITLGSAVATFRDGTSSGGNANIPNGTTVSYVAEDGGSVAEYGHAVYSTTGPTLTRSPIWSTAGLGVAANLSSSAIVYIDCLVEDLNALSGNKLFFSQIIAAQGLSGRDAYFYVDPSGSDVTGTGTVGNPWETIAYAVSVANNVINDLGATGFFIIQLNSTTYNETATLQFQADPNLTILINGNGTSLTTVSYPAAVHNDVVNYCLSGNVQFNNFKITCGAAAAGAWFFYLPNSGFSVYMSNMEIDLGTYCDGGLYIYGIAGSYTDYAITINSNAPASLIGAYGPLVYSQAGGMVLSGAFTVAIYDIQNGAILSLGGAFTGTATGPSYQIETTGIINTSFTSLSQLPGNGTGIINTGGQILGTHGALASPEAFALSFNAQIQSISASGALMIDYSLGRSVSLTLTGNITSVSVSNLPVVNFEAQVVLNITNSGAFGITWGSSFYAPGGSPPVIAQGAGALTTIVLRTLNGGTSYFLDAPGSGYSHL